MQQRTIKVYRSFVNCCVYHCRMTKAIKVRKAIHLFAICAVVAASVLLARLLPWNDLLAALEGALRHAGIWAPLVYAITYLIAVSVFLPATPLTLLAGALFTPLTAIVATFAGASGSTALDFLIARYYARDWIEQRIKRRPMWRAFDRALAEKGWRAVALMRWTPFLPLSVQNYGCGISRIAFLSYLLVGTTFLLPGIVLTVFIGQSARAGAELAAGDTDEMPYRIWIGTAIGVIVAIGWSFYIRHIAKHMLKQYQEQPDIAPKQLPPPRWWPWDSIGYLTAALALLAAARWASGNPEWRPW